jgi:hypothetical protein
MRFTKITALFVLVISTSCVDEVNTEFRADEHVAAWDYVKCLNGADSRCFAHSPISGETVHPVLSWCDLHNSVTVGELLPTADGWWFECDGGRPEAFEDVLCFYDTPTHVVCYGGSNGWFTEVEPSCKPNMFVDAAWPAGTCDADSSPGAHGFAWLLTVPGGTPWLGRAQAGDDTLIAVPECMAAAGVDAADPYACTWGTEFPCCSCNADNILTCGMLDENKQCPVGTSSDHPECA